MNVPVIVWKEIEVILALVIIIMVMFIVTNIRIRRY